MSSNGALPLGDVSEIVRSLADLDTDRPEEEWKADVIKIMTGCPVSTFWLLDERPHAYDYGAGEKEWHWKLRCVRNDPTCNLFGVLDGGGLGIARKEE